MKIMTESTEEMIERFQTNRNMKLAMSLRRAHEYYNFVWYESQSTIYGVGKTGSGAIHVYNIDKFLIHDESLYEEAFIPSEMLPMIKSII